MTRDIIPQKLSILHNAEELLRQKARSMTADDARLQLHLAVTEAAMDLADILRQFNSSDEDLMWSSGCERSMRSPRASS